MNPMDLMDLKYVYINPIKSHNDNDKKNHHNHLINIISNIVDRKKNRNELH